MLNLDVTCPETGRPERIGFLADADGEVLVVLRCTRFDPPSHVTCCETCKDVINCRSAAPIEPQR